MRLKVTYLYRDIDTDLDKKITKFFESIGFKRYTSGYNHLTWKRNIDFEKIGEEVVGKHESKGNQKAKLTA